MENSKKALRSLLLAAFIAIGWSLYSQSPAPATLLINDAQHGPVSCLIADSSSKLLFSAADDGSVHIFSTESNRLVQRLQVGPYPIAQLACGPNDQLACIERLPGNRYRLSVWNYRTVSQRLVVFLNDVPQFLSFSSQANFLICSLARWNSLLFLDLRSGEFRPWLQSGFGLVDFALMSSREDRVMSYQATSGLIVYHDLASGNLLSSIPTKGRLADFQLVPDSTKTKAVAIDGQNISVIDLVAGTVLDSKSPGFAVANVLTDPQDPGHLAAIGGAPGAWKIAHFGLDNAGRMTPGTIDKSSLRLNAAAFCLVSGQLYGGDDSGRAYLLSSNDSAVALNENRVQAIKSAALCSSGIYLSSALGSFKIPMDLAIPGAAGVLSINKLDQQALAIIPANSELLGMSDKELLFWDTSRSPKLNRLDIKRDTLVKTSQASAAAFQSVRVAADQVYSVDSNGAVRLWNLGDFKVMGSFNAQQAVCAAPGPAGRLLIGQSSSNAIDSTLQSVNLKTSETIPLNSTGTLMYQAVSDLREQIFYSLSIYKNDAGEHFSRWQYQPLGELSRRDPANAMKTILEIKEEDSGADLVLSQDTKRLFTSLGGLQISTWNGSQLDALEPANHSPRKLALYQDWLLAINTDGSASLYNTVNKKLLAEFRLLASGQLMLLDRNQHWTLANRVAGTKTTAADPKERQGVLKLLCLPMTADGGNDTEAWERNGSLTLQ